MSDLFDFYKIQAQQSTSNLPWVAKLQTEGLSDLNQFGFPTRKQEDWKYTSVDSLLKEQFKKSNDPIVLEPDHIPFSSIIKIHHGKIVQDSAYHSTVNCGVIVKSLQEAMTENQDLVKPYLNKLLKAKHGFHALNTALLETGVFIYIPKGIVVHEPLVLWHWQAHDEAVYERNLIVLAEDSQASIIEIYEGVKDSAYFTNTISEILMSKKSQLCHCKLILDATTAYHIGQTTVHQQKQSRYENHLFNLGGKINRNEIDISLQDEQASCLLNGIYMPSLNQHMDHHTIIRHLVPNCISQQNYKGILAQNGKAVFNGKVIVERHAIHSQANQENKNLLLSTKAEINSKPQLEIFTDDVSCTHGATVGQLDEDALFYLATRGLERQVATQLLIHAFAFDNLRLISNKILKEWLETLMINQLR